MRNFSFHISAIRGFATVTALSMALSATAFAQGDDAKLEAIENAYRSGDLETARAGLVEIAENASGQTQYRLGFMIANSQGGPFDRAEAIRWLESALKNEHNAGKLLLARVYLTGYPEVVEYERAAELLADEVKDGNAEAHYYLGQLYRAGRGVEGNKETSFALLRKSAEAGYADAQFSIAQMYSRGEGVTKDEAQASRWLLQAAESGNSEAQLSLHFNYLRGTGFPKNEELAGQWLAAAAEGGHALAQRMLGAALLFGDGENAGAEPDRGIALLLIAAQQNEPGAQTNLGYAYATGTGVEANMETAAQWYKRAADQGLIRAALVLGDMYQAGEGVETDVDQAIHYYQIAASGGDKVAAGRLGTLLATGVIPPEEETENGIDWIAAAAELGDADAITWLQARLAQRDESYAALRLGLIYADGLGHDADAEKAATYLARAARGGHLLAQERVADLYASGSGVEQDIIEAHKWANVAAANGSETAAERRDILANLMTADQIAEAQDRAKKFLNAQ